MARGFDHPQEVPHTPTSIRAARGMTLHDLAKASGVGVSTIRRIERGESGVELTTAKVADALGVSVPQLYEAMRRAREMREPRRAS